MVEADTPPSTCTQTSPPWRRTASRTSRTLAIWSDMNDWPPNPGSTVMTSTMSTSGSRSAYGAKGVPGLTAKAARAPAARIARAVPTASDTASTWKVTDRAPASAYPGAQRSGSSIIRWQSTGIGDTLTSASTTGSPRVRLGTKWLSMTSTCAQSAFEMAASSRSRLAKSADRIDGEICTRDTLAPPRGQQVGDREGSEEQRVDCHELGESGVPVGLHDAGAEQDPVDDHDEG